MKKIMSILNGRKSSSYITVIALADDGTIIKFNSEDRKGVILVIHCLFEKTIFNINVSQKE